MKKIFIIGSTAFSIINFRSELIKLLVKKKYKVIVFSLKANKSEKLYLVNELNVEHYQLNFSRDNFSFLNDIKTFFLIKKNIKKLKPYVILSFNVKPTIFTGFSILVSRPSNIQFIPTITGLGTGLHGEKFFRKIIRITLMFLYYISLIKSKFVIFQNIDDKNFFIKNKKKKKKK